MVLTLAALILVGIAIGCRGQMEKKKEYEKSIEELSTDIQELKDTNKALEKEKKNVDTDEFREKMARERLGMIGEDEYSMQKSEDGKESETSEAEQDDGEDASTEAAEKEPEDEEPASTETSEEKR